MPSAYNVPFIKKYAAQWGESNTNMNITKSNQDKMKKKLLRGEIL